MGRVGRGARRGDQGYGRGGRQSRARAGHGTRYYERLLSALEKLVAAKGLAEEAAIQVRKEEWVEAYRHTPHGQPVELRVGQEARRRRAASRE